jgi:hypothetical protein
LGEWWQHPRLDYTWITGYELAGQVRFLAAFGLLFALYQWAFLRLRNGQSEGPLWLILAVQLGLGLALAGIYPIAAIDLYDYVLYGRLGVNWAANPLAHPPSQFPGEPMVVYSYWPNEPSIYGPLWQIVSQWLTAAVDGSLPEALYAFKLLAVASSLVTTGLIWLAVRHLEPRLAPAGALLYGWNPLQQFETAGNGHNDALMVAFLALALLLLVRGPRFLALPALSAGLLVKITLAPLAPLFVFAPLLRTKPWPARLRCLGLGLALSVVLAFALYAPFWEGRASLPFLDRGTWFTASFPTLLRELLRRWQEFETAGKTAATISAALFGLVALWLFGRLFRLHRPSTRSSHGHNEHPHPDPSASSGQAPLAGSGQAPLPQGEAPMEAIIRTGYHLFFAYLVLACLWWQPWYLLVLLVFAALSGDSALADRANLFCIGGLLSYPVFKYIWSVHQTDWQLDYTSIMAMSVVAIFTLPLLHLAVNVVARLVGRGSEAVRTG